MEEWFHVLDTMLHPYDRNAIKAESRDGMSKYHFSLGLWMRNNWGLWGGSRLQTYLSHRGLYHPDNMSGEVLRFYNDYLWGRDSAWRAFDTTLVPPPPPDTATEALPQYHIADRQLKKILNRIIDGKVFLFPDDNDPLDEYDHCFIEFTPLTINDSTNKELVNELVDFFNDTTEKYTDLSCSKQPLKYPFSLQKPFICLTVTKINSFADRPSIGYIYYRKHYFMLTSGTDFKTINDIETGISVENAESNFSQFLKPTNKSRRFWKPTKYHHNKWPEPYRVYIYQEGRWYIIEER